MVKALCVLHNTVKSKEPNIYIPQGYVDINDQNNGQWRNEGNNLPPVPHQHARNSALAATNMRENFCAYFNSPIGGVDWQDEHIDRTR